MSDIILGLIVTAVVVQRIVAQHRARAQFQRDLDAIRSNVIDTCHITARTEAILDLVDFMSTEGRTDADLRRCPRGLRVH
jgi:hypothetical protein